MKATALLFIGALAPAHAAVLYFDDFDGSTGYNVNSTTALAGDNDWVDFANRIGNRTIGTSVEGYTIAAAGTESVLAGSATGGDPQIRSDFTIGIPKADIDGFELRIRIDVDQNNAYDDVLTAASLSVFWGTDPYVAPGAQNGNTQVNFNLGNATLTTQTNGWHLATWSFAPGTLTSGSGSDLNSLRIDATNNLAGSTFEIDSLTITGVPEPGLTSLLAAAALITLRRRR